MIKVTVLLEDVVLAASRNKEKWEVDIYSALNWGINEPVYSAQKEWTDLELGAVLALMIGVGEDGLGDRATVALYEVAEPLFKGLHENLRVIP